ncbi:MAG: single-stranded DNA-binding protein [Candidatus Diapherotrites archaeon]|uniref:Single-stranded DNA-binding protein n=1 Tax=Candidatus Iainarchaeum sp. TaxID=3101447 RepID=A0A2D6LPG2_9ARCH|nr:single-stranded DNA-binding protein [Candidatus Diapherotrites archaeon]|tara:strand:- start:3464 stop:3805 length:342 start_codon:yes stop_codon:yes gene_type:complete
MKISELIPSQQKLDLIFKVEEKTEPREVTTKLDGMFHKVCDVLIGDESGCIHLSLWDEDIDEVQEGKHYKITEAYTSLYRNSLTLNKGKYGSLKETEADFEINTSNNISLKEF